MLPRQQTKKQPKITRRYSILAIRLPQERKGVGFLNGEHWYAPKRVFLGHLNASREKIGPAQPEHLIKRLRVAE